jgi:hypothetical protein
MFKTGIVLLFLLPGTAWSQLIVKNSSGNVVLPVNGDAGVTIGTTTHPGALTTHTIMWRFQKQIE